MQEASIRDFWNAHPCGEFVVRTRFAEEAEKFFREYDAYRYRVEGHILGCLDGVDWRDQQVLEIGLGQGADSEQLIRRGARWSGLDLTPEAVNRVRTRLALRKLPFEHLQVGSILNPPYAAHSFDKVYSHGVLHHVPDIQQASAQIAKLLRPGGELVIMLYAKWSAHYLLSIGLWSRALVTLAYLLRRDSGTMGRQLPYLRQLGLVRYLRMRNFIHHNTDLAENPYSKVYDLRAVREDFPQFKVVKAYKRFMTCEPLPITGMTSGSLLGWNLWVHLVPRTNLQDPHGS
jgi:SAM-dependent methyltransferase